MFSFAVCPRVASSFLLVGQGWRWIGAGAALILAGGGIAAESVEPAGSDGGAFGKDIQLAPFVVKGKPLSISIHARTKGDRRYAERFADEVVEIAYETLGDSTGRGLVIVGTEGEPHPIHFFRKFLGMVQAGQLDPSMAEAAGDVDGMIKKMQEIVKVQDDPGKPTGITFDTFLPALPMPLAGAAARLYQLAWAEGFDDARVEKMLRSITRADLDRDNLARFDWVFYLPPHSSTAPVMKELMAKVTKAEKMGLFKRAAIKSALFVFSPVIKKAVESMRKGMLFMTVLRASGKFNDGDVDELVKVYVREIMPDLKPGAGDERGRALAAIEKQKMANAEYAKDPFVKPERLASYAADTYLSFEGDYTSKPPEITHRFKRDGDAFQWIYREHKPMIFYPAGDRLLVKEDGTMTIRFLVDDKGAVTGVEERWVRRRQMISRKA
jgi:hypothetical protein